MLLAACYWLLASFYRDKRGQEARSKTPQIQLKDDVSLIQIFLSNP